MENVKVKCIDGSKILSITEGRVYYATKIEEYYITIEVNDFRDCGMMYKIERFKILNKDL